VSSVVRIWAAGSGETSHSAGPGAAGNGSGPAGHEFKPSLPIKTSATRAGANRLIFVAVDIGGTFTDLIGFDDEAGVFMQGKSLSTPADLVQGIIRALVDVDQDRAREVAKLDDEVDELYHRIFDEVLGLMRDDPANVDPGTRILFAAHYLERIGDRVTNIAEDIVFLASGQIEDLNP